jgi:type III secretion system (T3SS) SseB-like protein
VALKNIPDSGFSDDDGCADPALTRALAAWRQGTGDEAAVLRALPAARLLVPVVAVLGEAETGPDGLRREKTSDMAVPTLNAPDGRRALPAFTSTASLAAWQADARPVAVPLRQALEAALQEQADTVVLDLAGPVPYELTGPALRALAEGRDPAGPGAAGDARLTDALRTLLAAEPGVAGAHLAPGGANSDGTLALALAEGADPRDVAGRITRALADDETLRARLVHGLDLALLPAGSPLPADAFHRRA